MIGKETLVNMSRPTKAHAESHVIGFSYDDPPNKVKRVLMGVVRIEALRKNRGYVLIGIFILAALLTPPDAISQCSLAIPMYLLYEGGILMARLLSRSQPAEAHAKADQR